MSQYAIETTPQITEPELELLGIVALSTSALVLVSVLIFFACNLYVAAKTKLPGRYFMLSSASLLVIFTLYKEYMGGSLEYAFGPIGAIYTVFAYSVIFCLFSLGLVRLCICLRDLKP